MILLKSLPDLTNDQLNDIIQIVYDKKIDGVMRLTLLLKEILLKQIKTR